MHTHHSHSGEYVAHAVDTLEEVTSKAVDMGFHTYCMTEHMPRLEPRFIYPEEKERNYSIQSLEVIFKDYYTHARELQKRRHLEKCKTNFIVGFEVEGINQEHINYALQLFEKFKFDMLVGSVHFVKEIPIDFDRTSWEKARDVCGGVRSLYYEYFKLQSKVLKLKPIVVGHFDLIRLFSKDDEYDKTTGKNLGDISLQHDWPEIWELIIENLKFVKSYGGLVELNSAAIRKGWRTPYPKKDVAQAVIDYCDSRFCFSDDSHSVQQVGLNYHKVLKYVIDELRLERIYYLRLVTEGEVEVHHIEIDELKSDPFWKQYKSLP